VALAQQGLGEAKRGHFLCCLRLNVLEKLIETRTSQEKSAASTALFGFHNGMSHNQLVRLRASIYFMRLMPCFSALLAGLNGQMFPMMRVQKQGFCACAKTSRFLPIFALPFAIQPLLMPLRSAVK
jgi:hypothetical protein